MTDAWLMDERWMTDGGPSQEGGVGRSHRRWIRDMVFRPEKHHRSSILHWHLLYPSLQFALLRFPVPQSQIFIKPVVPQGPPISTRKIPYIVPQIIPTSIYHLWPNVPNLPFFTYRPWPIVLNLSFLTHYPSSIIPALHSPKSHWRPPPFYPSIISKNGLIRIHF